MKDFKIDLSGVYPFVDKQGIAALEAEALEKLDLLKNKTGPGNDFLGWINLPSSISEEDFSAIEAAVKTLRERSEIIVVIGIGGSYLGARAVNEALSHSFLALKEEKTDPLMLFAGHTIGEDYIHELLEVLEKRTYSIVVISKSGTTTEPAIAFRILKDHLAQKVGRKEAASRIIAVTDSSKGALREVADEEGYATFVIPDDVGGRFSVFTPVGLVPLAACGNPIRELIRGAAEMEAHCLGSTSFQENPAALYAAARNALYRMGKKTEILVNYHPKLHYVSEWWKQLFGESEGKDGKGIFPAAVDNSTDLHSMGQYIQEGERTLFETILSIRENRETEVIPHDKNDLDHLNYLAGKRIDEVNKMAELGTRMAHIDGGVPNLHIEIGRLDARNIGRLLYFFELACGISGYMLGIHPFNQPGVEAYKKNMFALLEKPGSEQETAAIKQRLASEQ
jgi:glucose-6-phosphate isomerase